MFAISSLISLNLEKSRDLNTRSWEVIYHAYANAHYDQYYSTKFKMLSFTRSNENRTFLDYFNRFLLVSALLY